MALQFRTITARYAGTCRRCQGPIVPGDRIRYGGPRQVYHLAAACGVQPDQDAAQDAAQDVPASPLESSPDAAGDWAIDAQIAQAAGASRDDWAF